MLYKIDRDCAVTPVVWHRLETLLSRQTPRSQSTIGSDSPQNSVPTKFIPALNNQRLERSSHRTVEAALLNKNMSEEEEEEESTKTQHDY